MSEVPLHSLRFDLGAVPSPARGDRCRRAWRSRRARARPVPGFTRARSPARSGGFPFHKLAVGRAEQVHPTPQALHPPHLTLHPTPHTLRSPLTSGTGRSVSTCMAFTPRASEACSRVQGSGFRVQGAGFRVQGSGCRVQDSGFSRARARPAEGIRL